MQVELVIRRATGADFDQVSRVFSEENRFHADLLPEMLQVADPVMTREWFDAVLAGSEQALFVAEGSGEVVGVLLLRVVASPEDPIFRRRRCVYVDEIAVTRSYQGQGIGRRLMERAGQWAVEQGVNEVWLDVWEANEGALAFYERLGYKTVRRRMSRVVDPGG
jgi:ribosomal protein S18 acetylase RimI-like enzyme